MQTMDDFNVGDGATTYFNGDYYPFTVIKKQGRRIWMRSDDTVCVKPQSSYGADDGEYKFIPNVNGRVEIWSLRKNGRFKRAGDSVNSWWCLTPGRRYRMNPDI